MKKKIIAAALAVSMMPWNMALAQDNYATRGEVCDMLLKAADDYNAGVKKSDIIKGYEDGELHEDWSVTRAQALVMLRRAFGDLPKPTGHSARAAIPAEEFTDIPDWARDELKNIFDAGIVAGTAEGIFSPDDNVTKEQMDLFIKRVYALCGTNLKDDFYATVNKDFLDTAEIKPGYTIAGTFYDRGFEANEEVMSIISDIASKKYEKGTPEQKVSDFYKCILDREGRNKTGIAPIKPYLDMVDEANSVSDLIDLQGKLMEEICVCPFMKFGLSVDAKDSTKYVLTFNTSSSNMNKEFYTNEDAEKKEIYFDYIKKLFELGDTKMNASCEAVFDFEKALAEKELAPQEMQDVDKTYNVYTIEEIQGMFAGVDIGKVFKFSGLKAADKIIIFDRLLTEQYAKMFNIGNLDILKTMAKEGILFGWGNALNEEFEKAANEFNEKYMGTSGTVSDEEIATSMVESYMGDYLGEIYADRYFSEEAKEKAEKMVRDIIAFYRERIQNLPWMSDTTKEKALKKLDTMGVKIGYPDTWETPIDDVEIKPLSEGGSYFTNTLAISQKIMDYQRSLQYKECNKDAWAMYPFTVNACYNANSNDITFPAAFLQSPFYDVNASEEENLGGAGFVIAHEITHAFDNNGAKYDENGNATDWWTEEDYAEFQKLCDKVKDFYDGYECMPGIADNGELTLSENVADQGAIACVTEIASKLDNPDYEALYRQVAKIWAYTTTRQFAEYMAQTDVHSPGNARANRTVVSCDEFYRAFDIKEGDGMYIAPEDRVRIW